MSTHLRKQRLLIHDLVSALGPAKTMGRLGFHAFSGCDSVLGFKGIGNRTAWQTWEVCEEASVAFSNLTQEGNVEIRASDLEVIERFVVVMYCDRSSDRMKANEARMDLFTKKQRAYELIPPTQGALKEHAKRAAFQAGHIWGQSLICEPNIPCPSKWGWLKENNQWKTFWTALEPIAKSCRELTKCGCKTKCGGRCKCFKCGIACTIRCSCPCDG